MQVENSSEFKNSILVCADNPTNPSPQKTRGTASKIAEISRSYNLVWGSSDEVGVAAVALTSYVHWQQFVSRLWK